MGGFVAGRAGRLSSGHPHRLRKLAPVAIEITITYSIPTHARSRENLAVVDALIQEIAAVHQGSPDFKNIIERRVTALVESWSNAEHHNQTEK